MPNQVPYPLMPTCPISIVVFCRLLQYDSCWASNQNHVHRYSSPCIVPDLKLVSLMCDWSIFLECDWMMRYWWWLVYLSVTYLQYYINAISYNFFVIVIWMKKHCVLNVAYFIIFFFGSKIPFQYMEWCKCHWWI